MNTFIYVIIALIIIIVIVVIIVAISKYIRSDDVRPVLAWSNKTQIGDCMSYIFPPQNISNVYVPMTVSLNKGVIESKEGGEVLECVYPDQANIALMSKECTLMASNTITNETANLCIKDDGTYAEQGEIEEYYDIAPCDNKECAGSISIISLNFHPNLATPYCIDPYFTDDSGYLPHVNPCSGNSEEQFIYTELNRSDYSIKFIRPVSIIHRNSGLCIKPNFDVNTINIYYDTEYIWEEQCIDDHPVNGRYVYMVQCDDNPAQWAWLDKVSFKSGIVYETQLLYIGSVDFTQAPDTNDEEEYLQWLFSGNNNVYSMYWGGPRASPTSSLVVGNIYSNVGVQCAFNGYVTEILDMQSYQALKLLPTKYFDS